MSLHSVDPGQQCRWYAWAYGLRGWLLPLDEYFVMSEQDDWLDAAVEAGSAIQAANCLHLNAAADLQRPFDCTLKDSCVIYP